MAKVKWTSDALEDLDKIAVYIARLDSGAAHRLVERVVEHVPQLSSHPLSGPIVPEHRGSGKTYRQIVEPPCRVFYRVVGDVVTILHVIRGEMQLSIRRLDRRDKLN